MLKSDPTEELAYFLTHYKKNSFYFGEIGLGTLKLLDTLKEKGMIVYFNETTSELMLLTKEDCVNRGIEFEHKVISNRYNS